MARTVLYIPVGFALGIKKSPLSAGAQRGLIKGVEESDTDLYIFFRSYLY